MFALAIALFTTASLLCGLSTSLPQFAAMRILQGIGGALMVPVGRLVVPQDTPKDQLFQAIVVLTWPAPVAPVPGPPLGGLIVDHGDWRWIFWLNLPLGTIAFLLDWRLVLVAEQDRNRQFDWPGFLLTGSALFCLMPAAEIPSQPDAGERGRQQYHAPREGSLWVPGRSAAGGMRRNTQGARQIQKTAQRPTASIAGYRRRGHRPA